MNWIKSLIPTHFKRAIKMLPQQIPLSVAWRKPRQPIHEQRYQYQKDFIDFTPQAGLRVLDIGSGGDPFPHATVLTDRYIQPTRHRHAAFVSDHRPVIISDIDHLPFSTQAFDFVYCAHVLEHVEDPIQSCGELMRVSKAGYIETPTLSKDMLFNWAEGMHKWHVMSIANTLCFYEYDARRAQGIRSDAWKKMYFSRWQHPLQDVIDRNEDIYNVMFNWKGQFVVYVFYLDGTVRTLNAAGVTVGK